MRWASLILSVLAALVIGCGGDESSPVIEPPGGCASGEWQREDGSCVPPGLPPDMPCVPGEWFREDDATCIPAGVPPDGCGEGFVHDGNAGCEPILPEAPCPPGLMAVPGETRCREVAPCAPGRWGDIPVEPDTEYVDASYTGVDSDGSALKPWTRIQAAVDAATPGAIVAIAAGSYAEDVHVNGSPVRLWGVCPALVEVVATGAEPAAILVLANTATGTELQSLAIRGGALGVAVSGALDVKLESMWLHDNASRGVFVDDVFGPTSVTLRASLVEQNHEIGVSVDSSEATVEASVVRDTQPNVQGFGFGVDAQVDAMTGVPSTVLIRDSMVERSHGAGVYALSSQITLQASVVRDTQATAPGIGGGGVGVTARASSTTGTSSTLVLRTSLIEQSHQSGVEIRGAEATVEACVVRDTEPDAQALYGRGVNVQPEPMTGAASTLLIRTSLVENNQEVGLFVGASDATVEACVVRDTQPTAVGRGNGVAVQAHPTTAAPSTFLLRSSRVERNYEVGVFVEGSEVTVEACVVRDTQLNLAGRGGIAVLAQSHPTGAPSTLVLQRSALEQSYEIGVSIVGSSATIESCLVRDTRGGGTGLYGDGMVVGSQDGPASATITATRIDDSVRAALGAFGGHAALGGSALSCQAFDIDSEPYEEREATLDDLGGNRCGCPEATAPCKAVSAGLEAPPPLEPAPSP